VIATATKRRTGRPTKLTPAVIDKICDALRGGNYRETAAAYAGVARSTFNEWMQRGHESKSGIFRDLADAVDKALADCEARNVAMIEKAAAAGDWKAAGWFLERMFPTRWGRREHHQIDANVSTTMKVDPDDAVQQLARILAARDPTGGTSGGS